MVKNFIEQHWDKCIREIKESDGHHIALPYPFSSPTETDDFRDMFYWDTYFTNIGLLLSGREEQAKNNIENMLFLVEKYGLMPNVTNMGGLNRSQPPVLSLMVREYFDFTHDIKWLERAFPILEKEYAFWIKNRMTPWGLNCYGGDISCVSHEGYYEYYCGRTGLKFKNPDISKIAANMLAEGESGWDYTPRYGGSATEFAAIDLNSLLYAFENNMSYFSSKLGNAQEEIWAECAKNRLKLINKYLWNEERGTFLDRNFITGEWGNIFTAASYFALMCCVADESQAHKMKRLLPLIELEHGISCCEKNKTVGVYQWDYPNCWAPMQYCVVKGMENYGYTEDVKRLCSKYCVMLEVCFEKTNNLWEKYNAVDGTVNVTDEYKMPPMLGWTAGVYLYCDRRR